MGAVLNRKHFLAPLFLATTIAAGQAGASSIVTLEAMEEAVGPSMLVLPALEPKVAAVVPGAPPEAVSGSVAAIGEPAVTLEETAAVEEGLSRGQQPMVIRGGVVGDAVIRAAPSAAPIEPTAQPETAEAPAMTPPPEPQAPPPPRTRDAERPVPVMRPE